MAFASFRRWIDWFSTRFKRNDSIGQLLRGSGGSFVARAISALLALLSTSVLTNLMGPEYGDYAYALAWLGALVLVGRMGFNKSAIRYLASYVKAEQWHHVKGFLSYCLRTTYGISFVLAGIAAVGVYLFSGALNNYYEGPGFVNAMYIALVALPFLAQLQINEGVLDGFMRVFHSQVPLRMIRPLMIALFLLGIAAWTTLGRVTHDGESYISTETGMLVNLTAIMIALTLSVYLVQMAKPREIKGIKPAFEKKEWFGTSRDMMWTSGFNLILAQADMLMLGAIVDTDSVAIYNVASKVGQLLIMALTATNAILHPIAAGLYNQGQKSELQRIVSIGANAVFLFGIAGAIVLFIGSNYLGFFFSEAYDASAPLLRVLILGQLVNAFAGPALLLLNMTGHQRDAAKIMAVCAVLNLILNAVLIPILGAMGAAIATASTMVIWNLAAAVVVWKRLKIVSVALWRIPFRRT